MEENEQLRHQLGLKETSINITELNIRKKIELEQIKALNIMLQKEVDTLESERLELKSRLRLEALGVSHCRFIDIMLERKTCIRIWIIC